LSRPGIGLNIASGKEKEMKNIDYKLIIFNALKSQNTLTIDYQTLRICENTKYLISSMFHCVPHVPRAKMERFTGVNTKVCIQQSWYASFYIELKVNLLVLL
jgi:hypothetical protein